jgi:hypothetical protein
VHAAALVALACAIGACSSRGSPASPSYQGAPVSDAAAGDAGYVVCPPGLDASFSDLLGRVLSTQASCGTSTQYNCHSPTGAGASGAGNLLNFALADSGVDGGLDPAAIYAELVNHQDAHVWCVGASCPSMERVVPGDAGASLLYIKLTLKTTADPNYGAGMPLATPGSVCPETLDAFKTWIDQGAKMN